MKKLIYSSIATTVFLGMTGIALAENSTGVNTSVSASGTAPRPVKALIQEKKELRDRISSTTKEIKDRIASTSEKREEWFEKRKELVKNMLENKFRKMFLRYQATIDRERMIMDKINSRIGKVKSNGRNTTEAEKYTGEAKKHLDEAQVSLNLLKATATSTKTMDLEANASTTAPGQISKETISKLRNITEEIEKHLKEAHKSLERAVKYLKGNSSVENATSTPTKTSTTTSN